MDSCERRTAARAMVVALGLCVLVAAPASADWRLYVSGDFGYSIGKGYTDGRINLDPPSLQMGGNDIDTSPLLGGAFGIAIPMDEIAPLELPRGWRLPDWDVRAEIEAVGLRNYDFKTGPIAPDRAKIQTELDNWTLMSNFALDMPLEGLYRPISWTTSRLFGRWRLRTLKYFLDRATFAPVVGIGLSSLDATTREDTSKGKDLAYKFAWQAGARLGYQLTDRVNLGLGYRYLDPGKARYPLRGPDLPTDGSSRFELDPQIHEVRLSVRVEVWDFVAPWR